MMKHLKILVLLAIVACTKDKGFPPTPPPTPEETHTLSFVFANRIGFRNDSVGNSTNDTVLGGVCLHSKYYNIKTNTSTLVNTCFDRNFPANNYPLADSLVNDTYSNYKGNHYAFEVELVWKDKWLTTTKLLKYATKHWPNADTIYTFQDTIIKFVWPDDTMPGSKFHKTFQFP